MEQAPQVDMPTRAPIAVVCDRSTAHRLARAAVARMLRGPAGLVVILTAGGLGTLQGMQSSSPLTGALVAAATLTFVGAVSLVSGARAFRRMAPDGQVLTSRYDTQGRLAVTTGIGTSCLSPGSVDRVGRSGSLIHMRLCPGGRWVLLPGELLTEKDLAFLAASDAATPTPTTQLLTSSAHPAATTPMHLVSPQTQRDLQTAVLRQTWRAPGTRVALGLAAVGVACAALTPTVPTVGALAFGLLLLTLTLAGPAVAVRRQTPVGQIIRAAVTPDGLILQQGGNETVLPWSSFRSCEVNRSAVTMVLRSRTVVPLPRDLFPGHELIRLQRHVVARQLESAPAPAPRNTRLG